MGPATLVVVPMDPEERRVVRREAALLGLVATWALEAQRAEAAGDVEGAARAMRVVEDLLGGV